jgi:hypothetical protein
MEEIRGYIALGGWVALRHDKQSTANRSQYPNYSLRHGKKFWTWLHWHVDVSLTQLVRAESIKVRCWDVNKNTQPENPTWNLEG